MMKLVGILFLILSLQVSGITQDITAREIIEIADEKVRGASNEAEIKMTIVRPDWEREIQLKSWASGDDYSLILVTSPARDKGTAFLKRKKEMWNWQPKIDRIIKMPPSMMSQSWMGSDFTNDDLARANSHVNDYQQSIKDEVNIDGKECWIIQLIPNEEAGVVWGKILIWIDKEDYLQLKTEFYDEDNYLINTMIAKDITMMGGRKLPRVMEVIPEEEEGHKTIIEYIALDFNVDIKSSFFSQQSLKRVR